MVHYRRMGHMVRHLGNTTSTTSMHHLRYLWKSPRGTVLRIQTLAVAAIILTFVLVAFGSCRRWSNRWIVQKGFFAAQALSLSLGTYSIGLMQSSSVRSEMYPIWTVSLFALFGCIDPISTYNGFNYKGPLSKVVYAICLYCGYTLLLSISGVSSVVGNMAICMLSAITFIKGFHRTLALVQQSRMRNTVASLLDDYIGEIDVLFGVTTSNGHLGPGGQGLIHGPGLPGLIHGPGVPGLNNPMLRGRFSLIVEGGPQILHGMPFMGSTNFRTKELDVTIKDVLGLLSKNKGGPSSNNEKDHEILESEGKEKDHESEGKEKDHEQSCYDVCVAYSLSRGLQRHFLGLSNRQARPTMHQLKRVDYKWALNVVEMELALLHDIFFTGNSFLHYYQAKTACLWAVASLTGICFVGVAVATPGAIASSHGGSTNVVDTTTADLVVTFAILVSLALLQMMQLLRCWTSNWAKLAVVCAYARNKKRSEQKLTPSGNLQKLCRKLKLLHKFIKFISDCWTTCWMGLRWFVAMRTNWFDKHCLWQEKIGQYAMLPEGENEAEDWALSEDTRWNDHSNRGCGKMLGMDYIWEVLWDLLGNDTDKRGDVRLHKDVKESVTDFLRGINNDILEGVWSSFPGHPGPGIEAFLPYSCAPHQVESKPEGSRYTRCVLMWCVATWHCELEERKKSRDGGMETDARNPATEAGEAGVEGAEGEATAGAEEEANAAEGEANAAAGEANATEREAQVATAADKNRDHRLVANALAKYCAYLVVSVPELLPGPVLDTKTACEHFARNLARPARPQNRNILLKQVSYHAYCGTGLLVPPVGILQGGGAASANQTLDELMNGPDRWKTLAAVWVRMLVYAAPYGNAEVHMRQLAQGGEFITHLWALLYHLSIREWKPPGSKKALQQQQQLQLQQLQLQQLQPQLQPQQRQQVGPRSLIDTAGALKIINGFSQESEAVVVAFLHSASGYYIGELRAASKLEECVSFCWTTNPEVAKLFNIDPEAKRPSLVLLTEEEEKKEEEKNKFTPYVGEFERCAIAGFVSVYKLPLVTKLTPKTIPSLDEHPIHKQIVLLVDGKGSLKHLLDDFKIAAESFRGMLLFVFVEKDKKEDKEADNHFLGVTPSSAGVGPVLMHGYSAGYRKFYGLVSRHYSSTCPGQKTMLLAYTRKDEIAIPHDGEVSLGTIKEFAKHFHEDKLYLSEPPDVKIVVGDNLDQIVLDESKDVLLVIYEPDSYELISCMAACNKLAKHLGGIKSLVIAKMDCTTNWHPRANKVSVASCVVAWFCLFTASILYR